MQRTLSQAELDQELDFSQTDNVENPHSKDAEKTSQVQFNNENASKFLDEYFETPLEEELVSSTCTETTVIAEKLVMNEIAQFKKICGKCLLHSDRKNNVFSRYTKWRMDINRQEKIPEYQDRIKNLKLGTINGVSVALTLVQSQGQKQNVSARNFSKHYTLFLIETDFAGKTIAKPLIEWDDGSKKMDEHKEYYPIKNSNDEIEFNQHLESHSENLYINSLKKPNKTLQKKSDTPSQKIAKHIFKYAMMHENGNYVSVNNKKKISLKRDGRKQVHAIGNEQIFPRYVLIDSKRAIDPKKPDEIIVYDGKNDDGKESYGIYEKGCHIDVIGHSYYKYEKTHSFVALDQKYIEREHETTESGIVIEPDPQENLTNEGIKRKRKSNIKNKSSKKKKKTIEYETEEEVSPSKIQSQNKKPFNKKQYDKLYDQQLVRVNPDDSNNTPVYKTRAAVRRQKYREKLGYVYDVPSNPLHPLHGQPFLGKIEELDISKNKRYEIIDDEKVSVIEKMSWIRKYKSKEKDKEMSSTQKKPSAPKTKNTTKQKIKPKQSVDFSESSIIPDIISPVSLDQNSNLGNLDLSSDLIGIEGNLSLTSNKNVTANEQQIPKKSESDSQINEMIMQEINYFRNLCLSCKNKPSDENLFSQQLEKNILDYYKNLKAFAKNNKEGIKLKLKQKKIKTQDKQKEFYFYSLSLVKRIDSSSKNISLLIEWDDQLQEIKEYEKNYPIQNYFNNINSAGTSSNILTSNMNTFFHRGQNQASVLRTVTQPDDTQVLLEKGNKF